jgi:methyl-accepting chemotaxis protein
MFNRNSSNKCQANYNLFPLKNRYLTKRHVIIIYIMCDGGIFVNWIAKKLRNIKIMQTFVLIWVLSFLALVVIGSFGYMNISKQYDTTNEINAEIIPKLKDWGQVNGDMGNIQNMVTKIIDRPFDEAMVTTLYDLNDKIKVMLDKNLVASKGSLKESVLVKQATESYDKYFSYLPALIELRKQAVVADPQLTNVEMAKVGNDLTKKIVAVIDHQKFAAYEKGLYSKKIYDHSVRVFMTIFVISVIVLSVISLFAITIVRSSIKDMITKLEVVAEGDITVQLDGELKNEFGTMNRAINKTMGSISSILQTIEKDSVLLANQALSLSSASGMMNTTVDEVSMAIQGVSQGSTSQAEDLADMTESLQTLGDRLEFLTQSIESVDQVTKTINEKALSSSTKLNELVMAVRGIASSFGDTQSKVNNLTESINKISGIIQFINEISNQTSLLSLNASIEAARAGESGRGFAVVAGEIRKLAAQSRSSSEGINEILNDINREVGMVATTSANTSQVLTEQTEVVVTTMEGISEIMDSIQLMLPQIEEITAAIIDVNQDKNNILFTAESTAAVSEQNSASSEEISASTIELASSFNEIERSIKGLEDLSKEMITEVRRFKLS